MPTRKILYIVTMTVLTLLGGALVGAPNAAAHGTWVGVYKCGITGNLECGIASVYSAHDRVNACDTRADGYGLRALYWLRSGGTGYVDDGNGSETGCGGKTVGTASNPIVQIQACTKRTSGLQCGEKRTA